MLICYENACQGTFLMIEWLRLHLPMQRVWVQSLFGKVRSHMPRGQKKNPKQHCKKFNKDLKNGPLKKKKGRKNGKYLLYSTSTAGTHRVMQNAAQRWNGNKTSLHFLEWSPLLRPHSKCDSHIRSTTSNNSKRHKSKPRPKETKLFAKAKDSGKAGNLTPSSCLSLAARGFPWGQPRKAGQERHHSVTLCVLITD